MPALDHVRALAASLVFAFHFLHYFYLQWQPVTHLAWMGLLTEGHTGVGLFFTLSGFLFMLMGLNNPHMTYQSFIYNRFLRVFPLFFVVFLVAISINRDAFTAADWGYLLFSNLGAAPTSATFLTGAAWTIGVEFMFYLVFPIIFAAYAKDGYGYLIKMLGLLFLFKVATFVMIDDTTHVYYSTLLGRFDQFVIGMLGALFYVHFKAKLQSMAPVIAIFAILLVVFNSFVQARYASFFSASNDHVFWVSWSAQESFGWVIFIVAWLVMSPRLPECLSRALCRVGQVSYSFYLLHGFVIVIGHAIVTHFSLARGSLLGAFLLFIVLYVVTYVIAVVSFQVFERPFLDKRKRYKEC